MNTHSNIEADADELLEVARDLAWEEYSEACFVTEMTGEWSSMWSDSHPELGTFDEYFEGSKERHLADAALFLVSA